MELKNYETYISVVRCSKSFKEKLFSYAKKNNTTVSKMVRYALEKVYFDDKFIS